VFTGWKIVALAFLTNFISVGFVFYSYGVFFKALVAEFGGSRFGVAVGLVALQLVSASIAPTVGRLLDRGHTRALMTLGGRRGMALGLASMGISMSGVLMPPIGTALISSIGWRGTFLVYAATALFVLAPAVWMWVVNRPEDIGEAPDGDQRMSSMPAAGDHPRTAELLRDRNFWVIAMVVALNFSCMGAILTHSVPRATDLGFSASAAAWVLSVMAAAGAIGKPVFGTITDRVDKRAAMWLASSIQIVGVLSLLRAEGYSDLLMSGAVFGFGMGGVVPLQGALVGAAFGRHAFGRVMGLMSPAMLPITMLGQPFAALVFDRTGSYDMAFEIFVGVFALSMLVLSQLRLPETEPGLDPQPAPANA